MNKTLHIAFLLFLGITIALNASSQDSLVCAGDYGEYAVSSSYAYSSVFFWDVEGGTIEEDFGNRVQVRWDDDVEQGRLKVVERGLNDCEGDTSEYVVEIRSTFADLGMDEEICEGESVEFTPGEGFESYEWQDGSGEPSYEADTQGTYWVEVADEHGCTDRDSVDLTVHENPDVNIEVSSSYTGGLTVTDDSVSFAAGEVEAITLDAGAWSSYEWNTGDIMQSIEVQDTDVGSAREGVRRQDYWVTVENEYGCTATDSISVSVVGKLRIPNAFTPNDDQANDYWKIPALSMYPNCQVRVFDRSGDLVFTSNGYDESDYWDGTDRNGKKLPMASYFYVIKLGNDEEPIRGTVTIIR